MQNVFRVVMLLVIVLQPWASPGTAAQEDPDAPLLPDATGFVTIATDPSRDVTGFPAEDPQGRDAPADVLEIRVGETADALSFRIYHRDYPEPTADTGDDVRTPVRCILSFHIPAAPRVLHEVIVHTNESAGAAPYALEASLLHWDEDADEPVTDPLEARLVGTQFFEVAVPKAHLASTGGEPVGPGDRVRFTEISCGIETWAAWIYVTSMNDPVDAPYEEFVLHDTARRTPIRAVWVTEEGSHVAVPFGMRRPIEMEVRNLGPEPQTVDLRVSVHNASGGAAANWSVAHAPALHIPGHGAMRVPLAVRAEEGATPASLVVRLESQGGGGDLRLLTGLEPVVTPVPEDPALYFRQTKDEGFFVLAVHGVEWNPFDQETGFRRSIDEAGAWGLTPSRLGAPWRIADDIWSLEVPSLVGVPHRADYRWEVRAIGDEPPGPDRGRLVAAAEEALTVPTAESFSIALETLDARRLEPDERIMVTITADVPGPNGRLVDWGRSGAVLRTPLVLERPSVAAEPEAHAVPSFAPWGQTDGPITVPPGGTVAIGRWLANAGAVPATIEPGLRLPEGWAGTLQDETPVFLESGATTPVCVRLSVPPGATADATVALTATVPADGATPSSPAVHDEIHIHVDPAARSSPQCPLVAPVSLPDARPVPVIGPVGAILVALAVVGIARWRP